MSPLSAEGDVQRGAAERTMLFFKCGSALYFGGQRGQPSIRLARRPKSNEAEGVA